MHIDLNIQAGSVEEMQAALRGLLGKIDLPEAEKIPSANVKNSECRAETLAAPEFMPEENPEKIPAENVKNSDTAPAGASEIEDLPEEVAEEVKAQPEPPTMEETRAVLNELRKKNGAKAVKAILSHFSVSSFTELEPGEYAAVIEEARLACGKDE